MVNVIHKNINKNITALKHACVQLDISYLHTHCARNTYTVLSLERESSTMRYWGSGESVKARLCVQTVTFTCLRHFRTVDFSIKELITLYSGAINNVGIHYNFETVQFIISTDGGIFLCLLVIKCAK